MIAIELLSQAWLSWQPDTAFLSAVMALEVLLGRRVTAETSPKRLVNDSALTTVIIRVPDR